MGKHNKIQYYEDVAIEVTRRCNERCAHCLRGEQEDVNISLATIRRIAKKLSNSRIGMLTFTGGEPSLVPKLIDDIRKEFKLCNVSVGNFYIATNGKEVNEAFVLACMRMYLACDDNEISAVEVSNSPWHEDTNAHNSLLKALSFAHYRNGGDNFTKAVNKYGIAPIIEEGRATGFEDGAKIANGTITVRVDKDQHKYPMTIDISEWDGDNCVDEGMCYINVYGDIYSDCNLSYEHQDKDRIDESGYYIGNIFHEQSILEMTDAYNRRIEGSGNDKIEAGETA